MLKAAGFALRKTYSKKMAKILHSDSMIKTRVDELVKDSECKVLKKLQALSFFNSMRHCERFLLTRVGRKNSKTVFLKAIKIKRVNCSVNTIVNNNFFLNEKVFLFFTKTQKNVYIIRRSIYFCDYYFLFFSEM